MPPLVAAGPAAAGAMGMATTTMAGAMVAERASGGVFSMTSVAWASVTTSLSSTALISFFMAPSLSSGRP